MCFISGRVKEVGRQKRKVVSEWFAGVLMITPQTHLSQVGYRFPR